MLATRLAAIVVVVLAASACGGSKNSGSSGGSGKATGGLVANVTDAKVHIEGTNEVATAKVTVGGVAGKHLTLSWGLVDALQGNQSQDEIVLKRYVTTRKLATTVESVKIPLSKAVSPLLVHFVIYAPDGSYLNSDDTPDFGKGT
jgi:hypothetical protein